MKKLIQLQDDQKEILCKVLGLAAGAFTVFAFIALLSYLFCWKADMSGDELLNASGSLGYDLARFLVCDCFGLGSFALLAITGALCVQLFQFRMRRSFISLVLKSLYASFILAALLSYAGRFFSLYDAFGAGLGGRCGTQVSFFLIDKIGLVPTGLLLALFFLILALVCIPGFSGFFLKIGKKKPKKEKIVLGQENVQQPLPEEPEQEEVEVPEPEILPETEPADALQEQSQVEVPAEPGITVEEGEGVSSVVKQPQKRIDNRLDPPDGLPNFKFFPLDLLKSYKEGNYTLSQDEIDRNKNKIISTLRSYKIEVLDVNAKVGPTVTLYKVTPAEGVKFSQIRNLQDDIARSLSARGVRVVLLADSVGIEVANDRASIVPLRGLLNSDEYRNNKFELPVALGYTITQKVKVFDLSAAPHLLVAGATQQGKSVCLNVIISSLLYGKHPSELKFVFIDPKMVEFSAYAHLIKHYLAVLPEAEDEETERNRAIVKNAKDAEKILRSLCVEMDSRYELLSKAGVNKITLYNDKFKDHKLNPQNGHHYLPYLVVVVDEYADLTLTTGASPEAKAASRSITNSIIRLAQKGRAAGLHVILATQRPSVDVISGIIKSNFPMRIAFRTASKTDSQTIIDAPGAEKLIGRGDMLFSAGIENERIQCGLVDNDDVNNICEFIAAQTKYGQCYNIPYYLPEPPSEGKDSDGFADVGELDERFEEAARLVVSTQNASTSYLQTKMGMGFAKSARIINQLEAKGIVGPQDGAKKRQVLVATLDDLEAML